MDVGVLGVRQGLLKTAISPAAAGIGSNWWLACFIAVLNHTLLDIGVSVCSRTSHMHWLCAHMQELTSTVLTKTP